MWLKLYCEKRRRMRRFCGLVSLGYIIICLLLFNTFQFIEEEIHRSREHDIFGGMLDDVDDEMLAVRTVTTTTLTTEDPIRRQTRETLEERRRLLESDGARKLYLFSYMRGGSTLLGEVFNQDPRSWYWYEPLNLFYAAYFALPQPRHPYSTILHNATHYRDMPDWESALIAKHVDQLLSCQFRNLSKEVLSSDMLLKSSNGFSKYITCLRGMPPVPSPTSAPPNETAQNKKKRLAAERTRWGVTCADLTGLGKDFCSQNALKLDPSTKDNNGLKGVSDVVAAEYLKCPQYLNVFNKFHSNVSALSTNSSHVKDLLAAFAAEGLNITETQLQTDALLKKKISKFEENVKCITHKAAHIGKCLETNGIEKMCLGKKLRVTKNLRVKMSHMRQVIVKIPDIFIVHYVRDPRAIAFSQVNLDKCKPAEKCFRDFTTKFCQEMLSDLEARRELEQDFPGLFLQIRYEDLMLNGTAALQAMYDHVRLNISTEGQKWLTQSVHAKKNGGSFSVQRTDGVKHVDAWRKAYSVDVIASVSNSTYCRTVLSQLGYE